MAFNSGRRFSVSRSMSHALTLGDPKTYSNRDSDREHNFLEPNGPRSVRARSRSTQSR